MANIVTRQANLPPKRLDQPEPSDFAHVVLEVHQYLGQPLSVFPGVQSADQLGAVGIRPLEHLEELASAGCAEYGDDSIAHVLRGVSH